jgi:hypothetical protein
LGGGSTSSKKLLFHIGPTCVIQEEEVWSPKEAGVNKVYVRKTSLATPKDNDVRCKLTCAIYKSSVVHNVVDSQALSLRL